MKLLSAKLKLAEGLVAGKLQGGSGILDSYTYSSANGSTATSVTCGAQTHTTVKDALGRVISTTSPDRGRRSTSTTWPHPYVLRGWAALLAGTRRTASSLKQLTTAGCIRATAGIFSDGFNSYLRGLALEVSQTVTIGSMVRLHRRVFQSRMLRIEWSKKLSISPAPEGTTNVTRQSGTT